ncbi:MAG: phage baseplate assembly protein V [Paracoccaceae bacterium]
MTRHVLSNLIHQTHRHASEVALPGLRYAEVIEITDKGYILEWLSGSVRSRSAPARAARFMAGSERGAYFPFEVHDEVVVGFIDGHIDEPVILGALWSAQDKPPKDIDTSDSNNTRAIVSREGSRLAFDDTKGQTQVLLKSAGGISITLDDKAKSLTLKFDDTAMIVLDAKGVTVKGTAINLN